MESAYSTTQLTVYLKYLPLPSKYDAYTETPLPLPQTDTSFNALPRCQITRFPFENLAVHYSATKQADLKPNSLYEELMGLREILPPGRGDYCLEVNIFFYRILLDLGFSVYSTGARSRGRIDGISQDDYGGWIHMVNIVQIPSGTRYHVDVGFDSDGPTSPLPLV
ncbi:N-terminal acetyltransferase [Aspergillus hancockii]|nr:N-terminal acetyltransferase [Aspergillus hancockii]